MTDETKGARAKEILADDVFKLAEDMVRDDLNKRWALEKDRDKREAIWMELQGLGATRRALQTLAGRAEKSAHDRQRQEARINA